MAVSLPDEAIEAMEQSHESAWHVSSYYGDEQTIPSDKYPDYEWVPITTDGNVSFDADGQTQANGQLYLAYDAESLEPRGKTDPLATYGQELSIVRHITYAGTSWDIPLGRYPIEEVPDAATTFRAYPAGDLDATLRQFGWRAQLKITDQFERITEDDFLAVTTPASTSTWAEIQRLSPIPIVRSLPDATIPTGFVYQSRMDAITKLIANLGGEPHLTRTGALTARLANTWLTATETVAVVNGSVEVGRGMSNKLKNSVAVTNPSDATILAIAEITDPADPLRVNGPLGRRTEEISNPLMDTQAKALAAANTSLQRLSTQQSDTVTVSCLPRPDLELGDYIQVNQWAASDNGVSRKVAEWYGEVRKMQFSMDPTALMTFELTVAENR